MSQLATAYFHSIFIPSDQADRISPRILAMLDFDASSQDELLEGLEWEFPEESGEQVADILLALMTARIVYSHGFKAWDTLNGSCVRSHRFPSNGGNHA